MADFIELDLPEILDIPEKLYPLITEFNRYNYFLIVGGRASGKTQSVGRVVTVIGEQNELRIVCGRELQSNIQESVHTVLKDLITEYNLAYNVLSSRITHPVSKTQISFKGFREQGAVNVKGLEGVDLVWIDEAQSISKLTLEYLLPTIRKNNSKIIFTMNRHLRSDPVYVEMSGRDDCLVIEINYVDNKHCPLKIKNEAELLKNRNYKEFMHVYMGQPLASSSDYLFNHDKLHEAIGLLPNGEDFPKRQRVLGIDFAAQGDDLCVASVLDRVTNQHWKLTERIPWDEPDPMVSVGKIVHMIGQFKPDVTVLDIGGGGFVVASRLKEIGQNIHWFDGATTVGVDTDKFKNLRAQTYYELKDKFDQGLLIIEEKDREVINQAEKLKMKFHSDGKRGIQSKIDMKKEGMGSPDDLDSLMMAIYGLKFIGMSAASHNSQAAHVTRRTSGRKLR